MNNYKYVEFGNDIEVQILVQTFSNGKLINQEILIYPYHEYDAVIEYVKYSYPNIQSTDIPIRRIRDEEINQIKSIIE